MNKKDIKTKIYYVFGIITSLIHNKHILGVNNMKLIINPGDVLKGEVTISGSKNSSLPSLAALLLTNEEVVLKNVPIIADVELMIQIIKNSGYKIERTDSHRVRLKAGKRKHFKIFSLDVGKLRGSYYLMGALLGSALKVIIRAPGGCNLGARPIDYHLMGFEKLGATIKYKDDIYYISARKLIGTQIDLPQESVGATINIMLAAVKAKGTTIINNASLEPEVLDVVSLLKKMGAIIKIHKEKKLEIIGVKKLYGAEHEIIPDRMEAGSYLILAGTKPGNELTIKGANYQHLITTITILRNLGIKIRRQNEKMVVTSPAILGRTNVKVGPYPFLPTDLQQVLTALLLRGSGESMIEETIFENRFSHIPELLKMGANINQMSQKIHINSSTLVGTEVIAHDLRCAMSLVVAGCMAEGETRIDQGELLLRGYEDPISKLNGVGVKTQFE